MDARGPVEYTFAVARIRIDPDITRARTLPSAVYHEPAWYELQRERVFATTWHLFPDAPVDASPGTQQPWTLLPGCIDEPLLLVRGEDGLHCMSNVCTHRGTVLVESRCRARGIRCRYHGRRFTLDGKLEHMPEFEDAVEFPSASDDLPRVPHGQWGPLTFASLSPAFALERQLGPIRERVGHLPVGSAALDPDTSRTYEIEANWALYCDNYLEGFHVPFVHPGLNAALDYAAYEIELIDHGVVQIGVARDDDATFALPEGHPDHGRRIAAYYYWLYPATMLNFYPWGLSANVVLPCSATRTRVVFLSYVWDPAARDRGAGAGLHQVELEDEAVVEAVQRGVRSRLYDRGRYSPTRERGVHQFHRMLAESLGDGP